MVKDVVRSTSTRFYNTRNLSFQDRAVGLHIRFPSTTCARCNASTSLGSKHTNRQQTGGDAHEELKQQQHFERLHVDSKNDCYSDRRASSLISVDIFNVLQFTCKWKLTKRTVILVN